jgi:hypothetical protein
VKAKERKKRLTRSTPAAAGKLAGYMRLTQHIQGFWPVGGQDKPNLIDCHLCGIPHGCGTGCGSPALSFSASGGAKNHNREALGNVYIRYADDFVITASSKEVIENEIIPVVKDFLQSRGLTLSGEKSKITHITEGFDFLSQNIRKYKGKLVIRPSKDAVRPGSCRVK